MSEKGRVPILTHFDKEVADLIEEWSTAFGLSKGAIVRLLVNVGMETINRSGHQLLSYYAQKVRKEKE